MSSFQKTIKYVAIGLAVFLAIAIIGAIANIGGIILSFITGGSTGTKSGNHTEINQDFSEVSSIDVRDIVGRFNIKKGDEIKVIVDNASKDIEVNVQSDGTLRIWGKKTFKIFTWFEKRNTKSDITLYLPEDFLAKKAYVESGVGKTTIEFLNTEYLEIDAGVGETQGSNIYAERVDINGGVGNIDLKDVTFYDVDVDNGVGVVKIQGDIYGNSEFDNGIGEMILELNGQEKDYNLDIDSGIGNVKVNGKKISGAKYKHEGASHWISINGGIGNIIINFQ